MPSDRDLRAAATRLCEEWEAQADKSSARLSCSGVLLAECAAELRSLLARYPAAAPERGGTDTLREVRVLACAASQTACPPESREWGRLLYRILDGATFEEAVKVDPVIAPAPAASAPTAAVTEGETDFRSPGAERPSPTKGDT